MQSAILVTVTRSASILIACPIGSDSITSLVLVYGWHPYYVSGGCHPPHFTTRQAQGKSVLRLSPKRWEERGYLLLFLKVFL